MFANQENSMNYIVRWMGLGVLALCLCEPSVAQDGFGYTATSSVPFSYLDISGTGASVLSNVDDGTTNLSLPFGFKFYGTTYTSLCASSNGLISFGGCPSDDVTTRDLT